MSDKVLRLFASVCAVVAALHFLPAPVRADPGSGTLIIVDGSGSMWGKMEGDETAKFYGTRDFLRDLLSKTQPQSRVGLASFGHRRKGDCADVELISPIEAGGADGVVAGLEKLSPKGKGPLVAALREGAKAFGPGAPGSIILVHDNSDNCQQDVCALAGELAKTNPALRVHVVSLGLSKPDRQRMQCLSQATGGQHFDATSQAELGAALEQSFELAGLDAQAKPATAAAVAGGAPPTPSPAAAKGPPGLRLTAALAEGGPLAGDAISWRIARAGAQPGDAPLIERRSREINETLDPGSYRVQAALGLVSRTFDIDVGSDGPTVRRLPLDAGMIAITASASKLGDRLAAPVMTLRPGPEPSNGTTGAASLQPRPPTAGAPATPLWIGRDAAAEHVVPAGAYSITVTDGLASATANLQIAPGTTQRADLVLETGRLELTASAFDGGPPLSEVLYLIAVDDADAPQGRREIARSTAPAPGFTLQAGTYYVTARQGSTEVRERVAISSGDIVKKTLVLGLARLTVRPELSGVTAPAKMPVIIRLSEADGARRTVAQSTSGEANFMVGEGRYRIDTRIGSLNIRASQVVQMTPGKNVIATVKLEAGEIALTTAGRAPPSSGLRAAIRDAKGRIVWRSRPGDGLRTLVAPGAYVLQVESPDGTQEHPITVAAGESRTVAVEKP